MVSEQWDGERNENLSREIEPESIGAVQCMN